MNDRIETQIESLRRDLVGMTREIAGITVEVATTAEAVKEGWRKAEDDRTAMWLEVHGLDNKLIDMTNEFRNLTRKLDEMAPLVRSLENDRLMVTGAEKFAIAFSRFVWALAGAVIGSSIVMAVLSRLGFIK